MSRATHMSVILVVCFSVSLIQSAGKADSEGAGYVPVFKPADGFWLRSSTLTEVTPQGAFTVEWQRRQSASSLNIVSIRKGTIEKGKKYVNMIEEQWRRGKDEVNLRWFVCPDRKTLEEHIKRILSMYAAVHVEMEKPGAGERAWIAKGPGSLSLITYQGLDLVRVYVSMKSVDIAELEKVAANIARETLEQPWCNQEDKLNERIEMYVESVKKRHSFGRWRGKTKVRDKEVKRLDIGEDFFSKFSKNTRMDSPKEDKQQKVRIRLAEASSEAEVEVEIDMAEDPPAAQEKMLRLMALSGRPSYYRKCDPNDVDEQVKVGDVCFKFVPPWIRGTRGDRIFHQIFFCRNNVAVRLQTVFGTDAEKDARLPQIALSIDERLQALLEAKR